jgi:GNAT superfamily N-acetyltransferase
VVGAASGVLGAAGVNLIGGCVLEDARGHGIYRALTIARWELAVARGTPALTIQAGRMSRPIVERLGFKFIAAIPIYIDQLSS